ncbi:MAG: hypothetical protein GY928_38595 [Colwellia sp.]|nr:hypothetical protein [Colwellia sp.]
MKGIMKTYITIIFLTLLVGLPNIICAEDFSRVHVKNSDPGWGILRVINSQPGQHEATMAFVEGSDAGVGAYWLTGVGPWNAISNYVIGRGRPMFTITSSGSVGIGTGKPQERLDVSGNMSLSGTASIYVKGQGQIDISTPGGWPGIVGRPNNGGHRRDIVFDDNGIRLVTSSSGSSPSSTNGIKILENGNVGIGIDFPGEKLDVNGTTRTKILKITGGSDLSEQFDISKPHNLKSYIKQEDFKIEPGMVTCIDPENPGKLLISNKAYDRTVAGIISGAGGVQAGMLMGQKGTTANGEYPVALTGRVYCKADATYGCIQPGDILTTSETPGYVMKVNDFEKAHGATIGKAMSSLDKGTGLVLTLVSLQ